MQDRAEAAPSGRINTLLAVLDNKLFLYGGIREDGSKEVTFNDLWSLNLNRLDGWNCIFDESKTEWDGEEDEDEDSGEDSEDGGKPKPEAPVESKGDSKGKSTALARAVAQVVDSAESTLCPDGFEEEPDDHVLLSETVDRLLLDLQDLGSSGVPIPDPGEALPAFYEGSKGFWHSEAREGLREEGLEELLEGG